MNFQGYSFSYQIRPQVSSSALPGKPSSKSGAPQVLWSAPVLRLIPVNYPTLQVTQQLCWQGGVINRDQSLLNPCCPVASSLSVESLLWWSRESQAGSSSWWATSGPGCRAVDLAPSSHRSRVLPMSQAGIPPAPHSEGITAGTAPLQNPHLVSGRTHGGAAAGKGDPALTALALPSCSALQGSPAAQRNPHSPSAACPVSLAQPPGLVKPSLFDTPAFLRGGVGADHAGVRAGRATATRQLCVRRLLLPGCQAAL